MENMLRGSLTSTTDAKGVLGFKGERGYSNYEIYVKNGGTLTEEEWLEHFGVDLTGYAKTTEVSTMLDNEIGDLSELETENKDNTVDAINELKGNIDTLDERGIYSTTEKVIGTWADGKPLYRIVLNATTPSTGDTSTTIVSTLPNNIDNITKLDGMILDQSARFTINSYFSNTYYISTFYDPSVGINCKVGSNLTSRTCKIIIEYTKTTD
jgi:hypothetical protein